jgi:hypothetical protein
MTLFDFARARPLRRDNSRRSLGAATTDLIATTAGAKFGGRRAMHELALIEDLVGTVEDGVAGAKVHLVRLVVGKDSCASPHALRFAFELCTHGTALEGATLEIVETPGDALRLSDVEVG